MREHNATVTMLAQVADDESVFRRTQAAPSDPFQVWLTPIKQPRDITSSSAPTGPKAAALIDATKGGKFAAIFKPRPLRSDVQPFRTGVERYWLGLKSGSRSKNLSD